MDNEMRSSTSWQECSKVMFGVGDGFSGGVKNEKEDPEHQKKYMSV